MNINEWKEKFKEGKCCSMCGYNDYPIILHFHHVIDRRQKKLSKPTKKLKKWKRDKRKSKTPIFQMKNLEKIKREVKKCVLLCPNCHAIHHRKGIDKRFS